MGHKEFKIEKIFLVDCYEVDYGAALDAQVELEDGRIVTIEEVKEIAVGMGVRINDRVKVFCASSQDDIWEIVDD